jgi:hypothetical protein
VAIGNALLPAAADPMHRDRQTLGQSATCYMVTAHHPTQCRATEIEYAGSLLSGWGAQQRDGRSMSECPTPTGVAGYSGSLCHDRGLGYSHLRLN